MMQQRLMRELKLFPVGEKVGIEGIGLSIDPDMDGSNHDVTKLTGVIFGPKDTPYFGGVFLFSVRIPGDYPTQPPKVKILTTDGGKTRFNPNFYSNGKVCVSVLNTFGNEDWTAALNLATVFRSIQSMMTDDPFHNEPGFETCKRAQGAPECSAYAAKITHEVLRHAVCDHFENNSISAVWRATATDIFLRNVDEYLKICERHAPVWDGKAFFVAPFEGSDNQASGTFGFGTIKSRLLSIKDRLLTDSASPVPALTPVTAPSSQPSVVPTISTPPIAFSVNNTFAGQPNPKIDDALQEVLIEIEGGHRDGAEQLLAAVAFCLMEDPVVEALAGLSPATLTLAHALGYRPAGDGTLVLNPLHANRDNFEVIQAVLGDALQ